MIPTLSIQPADALIDVPRGIRVEHVAPGQTVEITALTRRNGVWQSHAAFVAGEDGSVDLTRDAPVSGDYAGVSPMGLIWSQSPVDSPSREHFNHSVAEPLVTEIVARAAGAQVQGRFTQRLAAEGVTRQDVREHGLVGTLYLPPGATPGSHPAVLILNGSGGGINEPRAALYASRGYAAFALAYFKAPGLSDYISNTPLEYFQTGLRWLRQKVQPSTTSSPSAASRAAANWCCCWAPPSPRKCRPWSPTCPAPWSIAARTPATPRSAAKALPGCWAASPCPRLGKQSHRHLGPVRRRPLAAPPREGHPHRPARPRRRGPRPHQGRGHPGPGHAAVRHRRRLLAVQPVLEMVRDKLAQVDHPYPVRWLDYENGGHSILFPYVPTTQLVYAHPVSGKISTSGGNPKDNARADQESWEGVLAFLDAAVQARAAATPARPRSATTPTSRPSPAAPAERHTRRLIPWHNNPSSTTPPRIWWTSSSA